VYSIPSRPCQQFFNPALQKNQQGTLSQGNSNLRPDSYQGFDCASTSDESILHKIIIIYFNWPILKYPGAGYSQTMKAK